MNDQSFACKVNDKLVILKYDKNLNFEQNRVFLLKDL